MTVENIARFILLWLLGVTAMINSVFAATPVDSSDVAFRLAPIAKLAGRLPRLTSERGGAVLSWVTEEGNGNALYAARVGGAGIKPAFRVTAGENWFLNRFDKPSVVALSDKHLAAHWLKRIGKRTYGYEYGIRVKFSDNDGHSWGEAVIPHHDRKPVQHGFVKIRPTSSTSIQMIWLDGGQAGLTAPMTSNPMALLSAHVDVNGQVVARSVLDGHVCSCCQPTLKTTDRGWLAAYRDRSPGEVRDITAIAGKRHEVHGQTRLDDGWVIKGCPLNGPALSVNDSRAALAWFTAAGDQPQVRLAISQDGGRTFEAPMVVATGAPLGQVGAVLLEDGSALVSWLELNDGEVELRVRQLAAIPENRTSAFVVLRSPTTIATPQMVCSDGHIYLALEYLGANRVELVRLDSTFGC